MIPVVGGTFFMGATAEQINPNKDETPAHEVTVSDFLIGETEVTQELWQTVTGSRPVADSYQWSEDRGVGKNYPAYYISYADCVTFIEKLNTLTGLSFRMPTEAEWEYAARGGSKSQRYQYSGSDNLDDVAWSNCSSIKKLQPVGSKNPNELGIYDMSGNVGEWCSDWYGQYSADTQTNPVGPSSGTERVNLVVDGTTLLMGPAIPSVADMHLLQDTATWVFALCLKNRTWAIGLLQITSWWKSFPPARYRIIVLCYLMHPSSLPTLVKAAMHLSRCSRSCPAETCTRIRACPFGTTG